MSNYSNVMKDGTLEHRTFGLLRMVKLATVKWTVMIN